MLKYSEKRDFINRQLSPKNEMNILQLLSKTMPKAGRQYIPRLLLPGETNLRYHLVTEIGPNGRSIRQFIAKRNRAFDENEMKWFTRELFTALKFLHGQGVCHFDIKLENIVISQKFLSESLPIYDKRLQSRIVLIDFGFSRVYENIHERKLWPYCGTAGYMDPGREDGYCIPSKSDIWSAAITFLKTAFIDGEAFILDERFPNSSRFNMLRQSGVKNSFFAGIKELENNSQDFKDAVSSVLIFERDRRPSCEEFLNHRWFNDLNFDEA